MTGNLGVTGLLRDALFMRIWLVGVGSGIARWLEMLVAGVYAYDTTGSPFLVALLIFLRMLPLVVFGSVVGTFADRTSPRRLLVATMAAAALFSALVFVLFATAHAGYAVVAAASVVSGLVWTTDMPLRRRMLGDVAGSERVATAMSLDSATNNATRMAGPLLGGLLYQWLGPPGAYALSASLYVACMVLMFGMPADSGTAARVGAPTRILRDLRDGFALVARDPDIRAIMAVTVVFNIWAFPFISMIPVVGREVLVLDAGWIGVLAALEGAGAFAGAMLIAMRVRRTGRYRQIYWFGLFAYLAFAFLASWMGDVVPMALILFCVGLGAAGFSTMQSTLIYAVAPAHMRGRMFGVMVICIGSGLFGFANIGLMGEWFGGAMAMRIVAAEGLIPLLLIGLAWRQLWQRGQA